MLSCITERLENIELKTWWNTTMLVTLLAPQERIIWNTKTLAFKLDLLKKLQWFDKEPDLFEPIGLRLRDYKYSIYFEDEHTHSNYAFMANRFYECVMNNTLLFYDARCKLVIEQSGYKIDPFQIVKNGEELLEKINILAEDEYQTLLKVQQSNFEQIMSEKNFALETIKKVVGWCLDPTKS